MAEKAQKRDPISRTESRGNWRLILLMACFVACYGAVGVRMGLLAATDPAEPPFERDGGANRPARAEIVDRSGHLLAGNLPAWSLYANPREIKDPVAVATALDPIFPEIDQATLHRKLSSNRSFVWIKRPVTPRERQAVHDLGFPGVFFGNREMRIYPAGAATAHIVGGVKAATEAVNYAEFTGAGGLEQHFNERLSDRMQAAEPLQLSLDLAVQQGVRDELRIGMERLTARGASAILMKAKTGEIVSMVSLPDFDPNERPQLWRGEAAYNPRFNRAAQGRYELGSTFKVLTAAMALDAGVATSNTIIKTPPSLRYGRHTIGESHRMDPEMPLEDVVVRSSNVGSARIAMMVGTRRFKSYLDRLGFFDPSGVELSEAARAKTLMPDYWTDLSTMTISFGHGLAASPVHLAASYATLANDGTRVFPSLVKGGIPTGKQVLSQKTAREMLRIMREVVVRGTAKRANVPGYEVGGKTGTAEKVGPGGYDKNRVIATFASVFPASAPEFVLIVSLDEPTDRSGRKPVRGAGRTAVPVAASIIRRVAPILGLRPLQEGDGASVAAVDVTTE
ncbi:MAG: penicillin-binding protein 2 [Pseudomonadota bacterium]